MRKFILATLLLLAAFVVSQAQTQCSKIKDSTARRNCLQAELRRTTAIANAANANLRRLDQRMNTACRMAALLDRTAEVASTAGEVSGNHPLHLGGLTWTSVRSILTRQTNERRNCESARKAVNEARKKR